jgi:nicotinamide riboside kinase
LFHEVYLGEPTHAFDDLVQRRYDLFLVCGLDVPWRHDGIREFEEQRHWMHERYVERAQSSGSPWVVVVGPHEARMAQARGAVDRLFAAPAPAATSRPGARPS